MKQIPLKHYRAPQYPELNRENEASVKWLLKKRMPARWKRLAASAAALYVTAGLAEKTAPEAAGVVMVDAKPQQKAVVEKRTLAVAPLAPEALAHGRGSFGCIAISPAIYLSEAEAKEIIFDELAKAGIHPETNLTLTRKAPARPIILKKDAVHMAGTKESALALPETQTADLELVLDWFDPQRKIAIEFMTVEDGTFWGVVGAIKKNPKTAGYTFGHHVDFAESAVTLSESVASFDGADDVALGIFTMPLMWMTEEEKIATKPIEEECDNAVHRLAVLSVEAHAANDSELSQKATENFLETSSKHYQEKERKIHAYLKSIGKDGEPQLRAQVRYFVKWLQEQGK